MSTIPLGRQVLIHPEPTAPKSAILVTLESDGPHQWATVLAIGPEVRDTVVGQRVYASTNQGHWVGADMLIPETAILLLEPTP